MVDGVGSSRGQSTRQNDVKKGCWDLFNKVSVNGAEGSAEKRGLTDTVLDQGYNQG